MFYQYLYFAKLLSVQIAWLARAVVANSSYHLKIAIADISDEAYDSGVFIKDSISGCQNAPVVTLSTLGFPDTLCAGANTYSLTGGLPSGGTYYGVGVSNGVYSTTIINTGTYVIAYTYSDTAGCTNNATHMVTIKACTTDMNEIVKNNETLFYPNPTNNFFVIETNSTEKQTLQIFDVRGKLVLNQTISNRANIDMSSLSDGVYNVNLITNNGIVNKRIVKLNDAR